MLYSIDEDWTVDGQTFPADALISVDLAEWKRDPNGAAKTLVWAPGDRQTKQGGGYTADSAYINILDNVVGKVLKFDYEGGRWVSTQVALPDNATVGVAATSDETDEIMFSVSDFLSPTALYYTDGKSAPEVIKTSPVNFSADGMSVEQLR